MPFSIVAKEGRLDLQPDMHDGPQFSDSLYPVGLLAALGLLHILILESGWANIKYSKLPFFHGWLHGVRSRVTLAPEPLPQSSQSVKGGINQLVEREGSRSKALGN